MNKVNRRQLRDPKKKRKKKKTFSRRNKREGVSRGKERPWEMQWDQLKMERWGRR